MDSPTYLYLSLLLTPVSSAITWFVSRNKRKVEGINSLQETVNMLLSRNQELTAEVIKLQKEIIRLKQEIESMRHQTN